VPPRTRIMATFTLHVSKNNVVTAMCTNPEYLPKNCDPHEFGDRDDYDYHNYGITFLIDDFEKDRLIIVFRRNTSATKLGYIEKMLKNNFQGTKVIFPNGTDANTSLKKCPIEQAIELSENVEDYENET